MTQAWVEYYRHRNEISEMLDPRCYSIDWLDGQLLAGDALAFGNEQAVIVVCVKRYPAGAKELHGLVAAGDLAAILVLIEQAEQWARSIGVDFACVSSRPGWRRVLKPRGYSVNRVELRKDL